MDQGSFRLPNGQAASYEWGSYAIKLSHGLSLRKDTVASILAALTNNLARWSDASEFTRYVGILHECTHCLQDLTTGVGLWDFFLGLARIPSILIETRIASWRTPFGTPVRPEDSSQYRQWLDDGFVPQSASARRRRQEHLTARSVLDPRIGQISDLEIFSIERLLEAEAVIQVHMALTHLKMGADEQRLMMRHRPLWSPLDMAGTYQGVYHDVIDLCRRWAVADGKSPGVPTVSAAMIITAFLLELSLAHPSEAALLQSGLDPLDHDPGLKFLLMLSALASLSTEQTQSLSLALEAGEVGEAERLLLSKCAIPYMPSAHIYQDWITRLEHLRGQRDDRRIELRLRALRQRIEHPATYLFKSMATFFEVGLPLIILADGEFTLTSMSPDYTVGNTRWELIADIVREKSTQQFLFSVYEGIPFRCSHAEFGTCNARTDACSAGLAHPREFPSPTHCRVRAWADESAIGTFKRPGGTS
jgi:hypothetical protein